MKDYKDYEDYKATLNLLDQASGLEADAAFKAKAKARLLDAVSNEPRMANVTRIRPRRLVVRTLAAVAALSLLMTGVGFSSTDSLPGDALYPVKRGIEEARLRATRNDETKANLYIEYADKRLGESERLKKLNRRERIEATLKLMSGNYAQAQALMNKVPAARRAIIIKRLAEKRAQANIRMKRIIERQQEKIIQQQNGKTKKDIRKNMEPKDKLQHFKDNKDKKSNSRP